MKYCRRLTLIAVALCVLTLHAELGEWHGQAHSAELTLPPLATLWLAPEPAP